MLRLSSRALARVLGTALVILGVGSPAAAQVDTGTILGTVKDQSGGVLPGATVTITHEGQGFTLSTVTRQDGTFIITPVRTGAYTVRVEFPGFRNTERRAIGVSIQQNAVVDFALEPGNLTEDVIVTANSPLLETGTGTVGQTLGSEMIENLPINGRDYTILARLSTGVVPPQPGARAPLMF
ncbi:MAG: carboxypeptidase-like regulatory domain-containing protein, partial [Vicinamibacterales bacterium]